jgi:hypothetical protein
MGETHDIEQMIAKNLFHARLIREEPAWALARIQAAENAEREVIRLRDQLAKSSEQSFANEQVRRGRETGYCPCCGEEWR